MMYFDHQPIGVLDSGIGGLSIAKVLMERLPYENIIYVGDTANMPYGKKDHKQILTYTTSIIDFLIQKNCKLIIIACNTASAATEEVIKSYADKVRILNVIDPVIDHISNKYPKKKVGLLCTDLTYKLGVFEKKLDALGKDIRLISLHASQLAHTIEMEFENKPKLDQLIKEYYFNNQFRYVDAIILGCTHYLWLKNNFFKLDPFVDWIDPSQLLVSEVESYLKENQLLNNSSQDHKAQATFYQSGATMYFFNLIKELTPFDSHKRFYGYCAYLLEKSLLVEERLIPEESIPAADASPDLKDA